MTEQRVIVVGAGPTGMLLAGDLAEAGVPVTLLERRTKTVSNLSRALAVHAGTLEAFDARGMADELVQAGASSTTLRLFDTAVVDTAVLPTRYPYILIVPQYETERVLAERLDRLGVDVVRGAEVTGLRQDADGVELDVHTDKGDRIERAAYVVGSDGFRSAIRDFVGLDFPGETAVRSVMLADVKLAQPPEQVVSTNSNGPKFIFMAPFKDGYHRVIAWDQDNPQPEDAPVDLEALKEIARATVGSDYGMSEPRWFSRFHSDERQVANYRVGRVFLAGDAAHVHTPAGGQGMNTGLQDAANLSWKLTAVLRGEADDALLDTYDSERHPVGAAVIKGSGRLLRMAQVRVKPVRAIRNTVMHLALARPAVNRRIAYALSGLWIHYPASEHAHPLVGHRAGDVPLAAPDGGPSRLGQALRGGRFVLLAPAELSGGVDDEKSGVVTAVPADGGPVRLVRPDGYVAWAADAPSAGHVVEAVARRMRLVSCARNPFKI